LILLLCSRRSSRRRSRVVELHAAGVGADGILPVCRAGAMCTIVVRALGRVRVPGEDLLAMGA
jgi:hypothetical protein